MSDWTPPPLPDVNGSDEAAPTRQVHDADGARPWALPASPPLNEPGMPIAVASRPVLADTDLTPRRGRRGRIAKAALGVVVAAGLVGGGLAIGVVIASNDTPTATEPALAAASAPAGGSDAASLPETPGAAEPAVPVAPATPLVDTPGPVEGFVEEPVAAVANAVAPAVVRIDTGTGTGSGIIYDASGLLVTNAHVVEGFTEVTVQLADGSRLDGTVLGSDPAIDVAVVQLDTDQPVPAAVFAPTSTVEVGQLAVAIGSPFGLEQSVTAGIVSAVNRVITGSNVTDGSPTVVEMVQTDAPINPGNSGGALADRQGRIVGMNTSIRTDGTSQGNLGVGFAIPSDTVILIAGRIVNGTPLDSGFLGVSGQDRASGGPGALVTDVVDGGPAAIAGLESGDLVIAIDGSPVLGMSELAAKIRLTTPGVVVTLEVERAGSVIDIAVTLGTLGST